MGSLLIFSCNSKMIKVLGLLLAVLCCQCASATEFGWESRSYDFHNDMWMNSGYQYWPGTHFRYNHDMWMDSDYQSFPEFHFTNDMWMSSGFQSYPESRSQHRFEKWHRRRLTRSF